MCTITYLIRHVAVSAVDVISRAMKYGFMNKRLNDSREWAYDILFVLCKLMTLFISVSIRFPADCERGTKLNINVLVFWTWPWLRGSWNKKLVNFDIFRNSCLQNLNEISLLHFAYWDMKVERGCWDIWSGQAKIPLEGQRNTLQRNIKIYLIRNVLLWTEKYSEMYCCVVRKYENLRFDMFRIGSR